MQKVIEFKDLSGSDLFIDALYKGGSNKNTSDDPINKLVRGGNQGGFRYVGSASDISKCNLIILYTSGGDSDWPDSIDPETGSFVYYGDNKKPGHELHDTPRNGNHILKSMYEAHHANQRNIIPPIFIFSKGDAGRDVVFRGICVPGFHGYSQSEDLVAIWRTKEGKRFQNYRAIFSILNVSQIKRQWISDVFNGRTLVSEYCPKPLLDWIRSGNANLLAAEKTKKYRTRQEQTPEGLDLDLLQAIYYKYEENPHGFEKCAAELVKLMDQNFISYDLTRPWQDGGRDAIGSYKIGTDASSIKVTFALEAKCYHVDNAVGVRETSRLISRLRHRQLGVLVTTSYIHIQAYKEIIDDMHPVLLISGKDIVEILKRSSIKTIPEVLKWLDGFSNQ